MPVELTLPGEVVLITGAGSGIGQSCAELLAEAGAAIAVTDLSAAHAERVAGIIEKRGGRALGTFMDVSDEINVVDTIDTIRHELGPPTIVVNNAFYGPVGPFLELTPEQIEQVFAVSVLGAMSVCRHTLPAMLDRGSGQIINILSEAGRVGEPKLSAYAAAKAALGGFTKSLAKELGPKGVRVNAVSPGFTRTPSSMLQMPNDRDRELLAATYPLRRLGDPRDIANAVMFLASERASWITGQTLSVSGGYTTI